MTRGQYEDTNIAFNQFDADLRTDSSLREQTQEEHHKTRSPLIDIPGTVMVENFPYDYMHLVCLGVMRKILLYISTGPYLVRLPNSAIQRLSGRLESIASYIPSDFPRKPRALREIKRWKA